MASANGEFVKIYLYLLRCVADQQTTISVAGLADFFNQTEADVCRALKYWDKQGVIRLTIDEESREIADITFVNLAAAASESSSDYSENTGIGRNQNSDPTYFMIHTSDLNNSENGGNTVDFTLMQNHTAHKEPRTAYTPKQVSALRDSSEDFAIMLYGVSTLLGGTLGASEMSTLAYFYDTLHFSEDLIEYLIEYCVTNGHKSFRYIEKVALAWAEKGITTVKQAKAATTNFNDTTYGVLKAFGITNRTAGEVEQKYIDKWNEMYDGNVSIIIEACNRTMRATHQPSFEYADTILMRWKEADVKTEDDIRRIDDSFEKAQAEKRRTASNARSNAGSKNKFNSFELQGNIDVDALEKALLKKNG
jgi:DnaD/phage-associated family protein